MSLTLGTLGSWLQATNEVSTLTQLQAVQSLSLQLAGRIAHADPAIAAQLKSTDRNELLSGLDALSRNPALIAVLESDLDQEAAAALVTATRELLDTPPSNRDAFLPENAAAGQSHTLLQYSFSRLRQVGGSDSALLSFLRIASERIGAGSSPLAPVGRVAQRLLGETQERPETSKYDYNIERVRGRFFVHEEAPMAATSDEGRSFFVKTRQKQLDDIRTYTSRQVSLNTAEVQEHYFRLRTQAVQHNKRYQKSWDALVLAMRNLGNMPNFRTVSDAYSERDKAIRNHAELRLRGIGPTEYDLLRGRSSLQAMEIAGTANDRERLAVYGGELDYALNGIFEEYDRIRNEPESESRNERLKKLESERFRTEVAYTALAQNQPLSQEDSIFLEEIRGRYLPYLAAGLGGTDVSGIEAAQAQAKEAYEIYSRQMRDRHLALAPMMLSVAVEEERLNIELDRLDREWQLARYRDLISQPRLTEADRRPFESALKDYEQTSGDYLAYAEKMLNGDPATRPYEENSKHRNAFTSLWNLHEVAKKILGAKDLEILTFTYKTQAQFIARGDQGIIGLEPIAEITARLAPALDRNENSIYSLKEIRSLAGRDWGTNQMSHYARNVHYIGASKLFGYLVQDVRPEMMMLEGGAQAYEGDIATRKRKDFARRSAVLRALHLGQLEFSVAMGSFYQMGLGHVTILAQASVGNFPTAGPFLYGLNKDGHHYLGSGALLDRESGGDQKSHEAFTREINIGMGNNVNVYESGTRDVARALSSPYANLDQYPETVHLPEYHGTGRNTGMSLRLGRKMGVPVIPVAYDLDQIYPEPSMPMPGNFGTNFRSKDPRKIAKSLVKSYGGFWNDRTMLRYVRPGQDDMKVAFGDVLTPESLLEVGDLSSVLPQEKYTQILAIDDEKKRQKALRWQETLHNSSIANFYERVAGYMATAGIYGPESRPTINGRSRVGRSQHTVEALRN